MKTFLFFIFFSFSVFATQWPEELKNLPNIVDPNNPVVLSDEQLYELELEKINEENAKEVETIPSEEIENTTASDSSLEN